MHGHMAFFGAYAMINLAIISYALPGLTGRREDEPQGRLGLWAFWLMVGGMFGMTMALAAAGISQTYLERILGFGYLETQKMIQVHYLMWLGTSVVFTAGLAAYVWDFACAGLPRRAVVERTSSAPTGVPQAGVA
jgi:nitric oxide reductase subunit B